MAVENGRTDFDLLGLTKKAGSLGVQVVCFPSFFSPSFSFYMGQYFLAVLLAEKGTVEGGEFVRTSLDPLKYGCGARITEHARVGNTFMSAVENLLCPDGIFYKTHVVWAGDFDVERNTRGEAICGSGGNKLGSEITSGALEANEEHTQTCVAEAPLRLGRAFA